MRRKYLKRIACAAGLTLLSTLCNAELPPYVYAEKRYRAPEWVDLSVRSVTVRDASVAVEAQVETVHRSKTGLKAGEVIRIAYRHEKSRMPGPSPVPLVEQGKRYTAYLEKAQAGYWPAAGGASFRTQLSTEELALEKARQRKREQEEEALCPPQPPGCRRGH